MWDPLGGALYWVDVAAACVYRDDGRSWPVSGSYLGSMALCDDGGAVLAMDDGLFHLDLDGGELRALASPEAGNARTVFNDSKVDRQGRFVAGSTDTEFRDPIAAWYQLGPGGACERLQGDIVCCNGPCWSPDGDVFYYADSVRRTIYASPYDPATGRIGERRVFATTDAWDANPDGATVDADGYLWSALFNGGRVVRFAPDGSVDREVEIPARFTSSVMFGGEDLDVLYVTSIGDECMGLTDPLPDAGGVFAVHDLGVAGLPEPSFARAPG